MYLFLSSEEFPTICSKNRMIQLGIAIFLIILFATLLLALNPAFSSDSDSDSDSDLQEKFDRVCAEDYEKNKKLCDKLWQKLEEEDEKLHEEDFFLN